VPLDIRYIPDCSHWVQQERPGEVNRFMEEWLAGYRKARPDARPSPFISHFLSLPVRVNMTS